MIYCMGSSGRLWQLQYNYLYRLGKERKEKKKEGKEKIYYNELITEKLLLSDSFIEGKYPRVKLKKSNEMAKRLPIGISIIVIPSALVKDILS